MATPRGTTPVHTITTAIDLTNAVVIYVTYKQKRNVVLEKTKDDIDVTAEALMIPLTQAETLKFSDKDEVRVQIRARFPDGNAVASNIMVGTIGEILKDGEI